MAFANSSISDVMAASIQARSKSIADNVTKNNGVLAAFKERGRIKTVSGGAGASGADIIEELSFAENGNGGAYSGYDLLPVAAQDVISAAQFGLKQYAVPVTISGLEILQNSGKEKMIDLMEARLEVAEGTLANLIAQGIYGDGTAYGGKAITGLDAAVEATATASQTSTYGGISRTTYSFWRNYCATSQDISSATKVQTVLNTAWANIIRGSDAPDLIVMDTNFWKDYINSLQALQRFTSPGVGSLGFMSVKFMNADVILDGGVGGFAGSSVSTEGTAYLLNTKYLKFRPHKDRNFVPLSPDKRYAVNQDAEVQIIGWAGNMTCSGARFQGRVLATTV